MQPQTALEALRESYRNEELTKLVNQFVGVKPPPTRKEELLALLVRTVEGDEFELTWDRLSAREKAMAAQTAWSEEGFFDRQKFAALWPLLRSEPAGEAAEQGSRDDPEVIFGGRGWTEGKDRKASLTELLMPHGVMSREIQRRVRHLVPEPQVPAMGGIDRPAEFVEMPLYIWNEETRKSERQTKDVPVALREMEPAAFRDLVAVLRLVDAGKVTITEKNRWPTPGAMRQVAAVLDSGDYYPEEVSKGRKSEDPDEERIGPIRAFAWPMLLQAGKLAQVRGSRLELTKSGRAALAAPPHEILRDLWQRWMSSDLLDELRRINVVRGQTGNGRRYLTDPAERRQAIAAELCECPVGRWLTPEELSRHMTADGNQFEVSSNSWTLYILEQQYGSLAYDNGNILELRYLLCVLMEYAATLGLIDLAYIPPAGARPDYGDLWGTDDLAFFSRYDGLMFLRLTALGAYILGLNGSFAPVPPQVRQVLSVEPNLEIAATGPLSASDVMMLDAFAKGIGEKVWQLDPERILDAQAAGRGAGELVGFLEAASGAEIPEEVDRFLRELAARAGALRDLGPARLIACADPELSAFIASHPTTRKLCRPAGKDALVVAASDLAAFRRALRKLGFVLPQS